MKNLLTRTLAGLVYIAAIIASLVFGDVYFVLLLSIFAIAGVQEFVKVMVNVDHSDNRMTRGWDMVGAATIVVFNAIQASDWHSLSPMPAGIVLSPILLYIVVRMVVQLYIKQPAPMHSLTTSLAAQVYVSVPLALMTYMYYIYSPMLLLAMFIMIWLNDTGAYVAGSLLGRHKLFERLSPKKSWEGFFGGLVFTVGGALAIYYLMDGWLCGMSVAAAIGMGLVVTVFSTWGDLVESMLKRSAGVKDSGHLIPGHGGILDRIDSLLLVVPALLYYLSVVM